MHHKAEVEFMKHAVYNLYQRPFQGHSGQKMCSLWAGYAERNMQKVEMSNIHLFCAKSGPALMQLVRPLKNRLHLHFGAANYACL